MIGFVKTTNTNSLSKTAPFSFSFSFSFLFLFFSLFFTPFHPPPSLSLMINIPMIVGVIVLMMVIVVSADDTQALRDTVSSLCSLNKAGQFHSCCLSYDINSLSLEYSPARRCFIYGFSLSGGSAVTFLFVD